MKYLKDMTEGESGEICWIALALSDQMISTGMSQKSEICLIQKYYNHYIVKCHNRTLSIVSNGYDLAIWN